MADPRGFLEHARAKTPKRPADQRIGDWEEVESELPAPALKAQASRCMDCGVPFCHKGCPLGNDIPDWNDLVRRGRWSEAITALHATNNFPEFTGRTCPAPCEQSCVLELSGEPVTIKQLEKQIIDVAWDNSWVRPEPSPVTTGKRVAIVGSGPAGLAAAQQLARVGHDVTVFERDDQAGGLLRYGIPDFKLHKLQVQRRIEQLEGEGVTFRLGVDVGEEITGSQLLDGFDAVCLAVGAREPREMDLPGRDLSGVHQAMPYLEQANRVVAGSLEAPAIDATGKQVVILGGGDTGADCLGTAHRQGAAHVHHLHYKPAPPGARTDDMPWPWWPLIHHPSSSHEEGGQRGWSIVATGFRGEDGHVVALEGVRVSWSPDTAGGRPVMRRVEGSELEIPCDLVLLAVGFSGVEPLPLHTQLGVEVDRRGRLRTVDGYRTTADRVWTAGDASRGASLVVWAIHDGRQAAREIDLALMGRTRLPPNPDPLPLKASRP